MFKPAMKKIYIYTCEVSLISINRKDKIIASDAYF